MRRLRNIITPVFLSLCAASEATAFDITTDANLNASGASATVTAYHNDMQFGSNLSVSNFDTGIQNMALNKTFFVAANHNFNGVEINTKLELIVNPLDIDAASNAALTVSSNVPLGKSNAVIKGQGSPTGQIIEFTVSEFNKEPLQRSLKTSIQRNERGEMDQSFMANLTYKF
jgi:hypothetical protein